MEDMLKLELLCDGSITSQVIKDIRVAIHLTKTYVDQEK